jgi:hypothetical protein
MKNKIYILSLFLIVMLGLNSCQDNGVQEYIPRTIIEGILIVDQPIENIKVIKTQPVFEKYNYEKALIRDAKVFVKGDGKVFELIIDPTGEKGYYSQDKSYLIKPNTEYTLEIILNDNSVMKGKTVTPERTEWIIRPKEFIQYPMDTLKLKATDTIKWKPIKDLNYYMLNIKCLDTLNYGIYLTPQTTEMNRRCYNLVTEDKDGEEFKEISESPFIDNSQSSVVWNVFKWFGKHEISVYAMDANMIKWYLQSFNFREFDQRLNSITDGYGCFGSASMIKDTSILLKNQP